MQVVVDDAKLEPSEYQDDFMEISLPLIEGGELIRYSDGFYSFEDSTFVSLPLLESYTYTVNTLPEIITYAFDTDELGVPKILLEGSNYIQYTEVFYNRFEDELAVANPVIESATWSSL